MFNVSLNSFIQRGMGVTFKLLQRLPKPLFAREIKSFSTNILTEAPKTGTGTGGAINQLTGFKPYGIFQQSVRTRIRYHKRFENPRDYIRLSRFGYESRMATPNGRAIIMNRILKGRFNLAHDSVPQTILYQKRRKGEFPTVPLWSFKKKLK